MANQFKAPAVQVSFHGFLFDMDGTIIDSTAAVVKHWHSVGTEIGVEPEVILQTSHGRRSIDVLKILCPEKANWEYICYMEGLLPKNYGKDAIEIPGARPLLAQLIAHDAPWAIVTSGTLPLVGGWLDVLDIPRPAVLVTAESVENGKPDPSCYVMGRERLGLQVREEGGEEKTLLVLEDSPAGIKAGKAAGCRVLALVTSHSLEQVREAGPDWVVRDLRDVRVVEMRAGVVTIEIVNVLA